MSFTLISVCARMGVFACVRACTAEWESNIRGEEKVSSTLSLINHSPNLCAFLAAHYAA